MNEQELQTKVKVLVEGSTYHWRDSNNRALCDRRQEGVLTPLLELPALTFVCARCTSVVAMMTKGW